MKVARYVLVLLLLPLLSLRARDVTLEEYLERLQASHPFFAKEVLKVAIAEREADATLGGQEWMFNLSPAYGYNAGAGESDAQSATFSAGLRRSFWSTGGTLGFGLSSAYVYDRGTPFGDTESYSQGLSLSYAQPPARNRGGALDRLGHEVAGFNATRVKAEIEETQERFLLEKALGFLDWALLAEQVRIAERRVALAREQLGQVQRRFASQPGRSGGRAAGRGRGAGRRTGVAAAAITAGGEAGGAGGADRGLEPDRPLLRPLHGGRASGHRG